MYIYYDSKTGNVERFINKIKKIKEDWIFTKINPELKIENEGHLIIFTTKIGEVAESTRNFLLNAENRKYIKSVSSSGNMNWGIYFALAADKVSKEFGIPLGMKFELSGTQIQVN